MKKLVLACVVTRILMCTWMIVSDKFVTDYDSSTSALHMNQNTTTLDAFERWDSEYFLHIAKDGYEFEHFHAFFPLYPLMIRYFTLNFVQPIMGSLFEIRQLYALSGVVISNASFVLASIGLIALTNRIFKRKELTFWTGVLFAINPASVFMSAVYTESTYTMLAIWGMYFYTLSADYFGNTRTPALFGLLSAALFALATATRGNGIILCGFFAYHFMRSFRQGSILPRFMLMVIQCAITLAPYVFFQYYSYERYCTVAGNSNLANIMMKNATHYTLEDFQTAKHAYLAANHPWCNSKVPHLYTFVQEKYWNNGFLRYWTVKQLPNFLLAAPMLTLTFYGCFSYLKYLHRTLSVGDILFKSKLYGTASDFEQSTSSFVFVFYWFCLGIYALLLMHIQVATRFLAHCPALYWFVGTMFARQETKRYVVLAYFVLYNFLGGVLFSNFYPWT